MRNSIRASTSLNKMNYDTNHSTNNNIISLDIKNIDSISKKENNLTHSEAISVAAALLLE